MDKQTKTIKIYLTESEKNDITTQASKQQLSVSEYAKAILLKGPVILNISVNDLFDYTWHIYEIGNKIQELLNILNRSDDTIDAIYAANVIKKLLADINNSCNETLKINYNERKKIYNELETQIRNSIY